MCDPHSKGGKKKCRFLCSYDTTHAPCAIRLLLYFCGLQTHLERQKRYPLGLF